MDVKKSKMYLPWAEYTCRYIKSTTEHFEKHTHDGFCELFYTVQGQILHEANGKSEVLLPRTLVFVRENDIHNYVHDGKNYFEFINLSFPNSVLDSLIAYLNADEMSNLLTALYPPTVRLSPFDGEKLFDTITPLLNVDALYNPINEKTNQSYYSARFKQLFVNIFTDYFLSPYLIDTITPPWLLRAYSAMKITENFVAGIDRMVELSGKSQEYLTRSLKKYYHIQPHQYITALRLAYAAELLAKTEKTITEIYLDCGFQSTSSFYQAFTKKYRMTPKEYRQKTT